MAFLLHLWQVAQQSIQVNTSQLWSFPLPMSTHLDNNDDPSCLPTPSQEASWASFTSQVHHQSPIPQTKEHCLSALQTILEQCYSPIQPASSPMPPSPSQTHTYHIQTLLLPLVGQSKLILHPQNEHIPWSQLSPQCHAPPHQTITPSKTQSITNLGDLLLFSSTN